MFASSRVLAISKKVGIAALCLILTSAWADTGQANLIVHVSSFTHARGHAAANLFREGDDVLKPETAYRRASAEIHNGSATVVFAGVEYGKYAVFVFHDENDNGALDHNFLRLPAEPLGFSNDFKISVVSGMPSFEKLHFYFTVDTPPLEIFVK